MKSFEMKHLLQCQEIINQYLSRQADQYKNINTDPEIIHSYCPYASFYSGVHKGYFEVEISELSKFTMGYYRSPWPTIHRTSTYNTYDECLQFIKEIQKEYPYKQLTSMIASVEPSYMYRAIPFAYYEYGKHKYLALLNINKENQYEGIGDILLTENKKDQFSYPYATPEQFQQYINDVKIPGFSD